MNEEQHEGKAENTFKNFGKKVDSFIEEFDEAADRLRKEFQEKYEELKVTAERIKSESKNRDRWQEVEDNLKKAADQLKQAFEAAFRNREEKRDQP